MTSAAHPLPHWLTVSTGPAPAVVDGRASRTRAAFFEEVARALRLPGYFGRNWDALTDSLRDTGAVTLIVEHAEELLSAEPPGQFTTLLAVLADAARDGLTVTLCTDPDHEALLRQRAAAALSGPPDS
jgi:RNAse (barnase) inhibitor barstar